MALKWRERIAVDPQGVVGKPVSEGTRLAVEFVVELLAAGWTQQQILDDYPHICQEDMRTCLAYIAEVLHSEHSVPLQPAWRFVAGENFSREALRLPRQSGGDVCVMAETHPEVSDSEVLDIASTENRTLLTFDKDFGDLAFRQGLPASCGVILFPMGSVTPTEYAALAVAALQSGVTWAGHFC